MSELREELLGTAINKKRIIGVLLVSILLISMFAFSVFFFSSLFGSQRTNPNKEKANTDYEDAETVIPPPPLDFLEELLKYLNDTGFLNDFINLVDPEDFADILAEMMDGDIDNFDISGFSEVLLPLLGAAGYSIFGEQEVFRVYNSSSPSGSMDINKITDNLWKYETFDEYNGDSWSSTANVFSYDFISFLDYATKYSSQDILKIKMPLTPEQGPNSMVIPTLFPIPFVIENSIFAPNLDLTSLSLNKDDFNSTILDLDFYTNDDVNLSFEIFGLDLPSEQDINNSAVLVTNPSADYLSLLNYFTQLPPDIINYINSHPYFESHYDALDSIIEDTDNAFFIALKIRNYLHDNFNLGFDAVMNDPADEGEDIVEWFCEHEEGLYSEFASAFCVFARAFNVATRFIDGFKTESFSNDTYTWEVDEIYDSEEGAEAILIKYKHLYNWAEIYIPSDITGNGKWIQFDVMSQQSPLPPAPPPPPPQYNLNLYSNFTAGFRGQVTNFTAILSSPTGSSVVNKTITFSDISTGYSGEIDTDENGRASLLVDIDNSQIVGPHVIVASYDDYNVSSNTVIYVVYGNVDVILTNPPIEINRSISNTTLIQGYVNDPVANQRVEGATVEFLLLQSGTNNKIASPFDIIYTDTDSNGDFDTYITLDPSVMRGTYDLRVDFNGSWYSYPYAVGMINSSSNRIQFNVTEETKYNLLFSINGTPTDYPFTPNLSNLINVKKNQQLNLSVTLIDDYTKIPEAGVNVEFYDYTNGDIPIGSDVTDSNGIAWISHNTGTNKAGPTLVYAKTMRNTNYSYFILNESINFQFLFGPNPRVINRTGSYGTQFDIACNLVDYNVNPVDYSQIELKMYSGVIERSNWLNPQTPIFYNAGGIFNINNIGVQSYADATNYTLNLNFNGDFLLTNDPINPYPYDFNINYLSNVYVIPNELKVLDPENVNITLRIEGQHTRIFYDDLNPPATYNQSDTAHFQVQVSHVFNLDGNPVYLYDEFVSSTVPLDTYFFPGGTGSSGFVQFNISTASLHAGLHRIRVQYHIYSTINVTYIIINNTVEIYAFSSDSEILRGADNFLVYGSLQDGGEYLRGLNISIILLDSSFTDVSFYLNLAGTKSVIINNDGTYSYSINSIAQTCPQGKYYIIINFSGSLRYPRTALPDVLLTNHMINTNSTPIPLNVSAGTNIQIDTYYTDSEDDYPEWSHLWIDKDWLHVNGTLRWDNGGGISGVNITITIIDERDQSIVTEVTYETNISGEFNVSIYIDPSEDWTYLRSNTEIKITFDPSDQIPPLEYVQSDTESIFP